MNTTILCPNYNRQLSNEACTNNNNESVNGNHETDINERIKINDVVQRQQTDERIRPYSWQNYGWCNTDYTCKSKKNDVGYRHTNKNISYPEKNESMISIDSIDSILRSQQNYSQSSSSGRVALDTVVVTNNNSSIHKSVSMSSLKTIKNESIRFQTLRYDHESLYLHRQRQKDHSQSNNRRVTTLDNVVIKNNPIHKSLSVSSLLSLSSLNTMQNNNESIRPQSPCYDREALYLTIRRDLRMLYSLSDDSNETETHNTSRRRKDSYIDQI